jgi:DNA repair protein RecO (recombination protein O)
MIDAIVTGGVDVGVTSRIVRLLTAEQGRISAMARGVRSARSPMRGMTDPGTRIAIELQKGRGDLATIRVAELRTGVRRPRDDLGRLLLLGYGCELCAALAPEHDAAPKLYGQLDAWLDRLEAEPPIGDASRIALEAKALTFAGIAPALARCARCAGAIEDPCAFDSAAGGAVHARCGGGAVIDAVGALWVDHLRHSKLADAETIKFPHAFRWLLSDFARYHLGHDLRTRELLATL